MRSARGRLGLLPQKGKGEQNFEEEERVANAVQVWGYLMPGGGATLQDHYFHLGIIL